MAAISAFAAAIGYRYAEGEVADSIDPGRTGRLHILEVQRLIRFMPKVVIAVVPGFAVGGGHSLHVVADLTLASAEHAVFKQTDTDVASFDGGYGSAYLARQIGQKFAREIFFLGRSYSAADAHAMGMVNAVGAARGTRVDGARMGGRDQHEESDGPADGEVRDEPGRRRAGSASRSSPARRRDSPT